MAKKRLIHSQDFPSEFTYKILKRDDKIFKIKNGLYLLKDCLEDATTLFYRHYWSIVVIILKKYELYSLERESALRLYLDDESIPQTLFVRTKKNVGHTIPLPFNTKIMIRPDHAFHVNTRVQRNIGGTPLFLDVPERVLLHSKIRSGVLFNAFVRGLVFNKPRLEMLYYANPKPITVKRIILAAHILGNEDLAKQLKEIQRKHTIYRV